MMRYFTSEKNRGICPKGWHIPTHNDMIVLSNHLGGNDAAGGKLKEKGTAHWKDIWSNSNVGATDEFGFTALPGGCRSLTQFAEKGEYGWWWTTNRDNDFPNTAEVWEMRAFDSWFGTTVYLGSYWPSEPKTNGCSVRCTRDE